IDARGGATQHAQMIALVGRADARVLEEAPALLVWRQMGKVSRKSLERFVAAAQRGSSGVGICRLRGDRQELPEGQRHAFVRMWPRREQRARPRNACACSSQKAR